MGVIYGILLTVWLYFFVGVWWVISPYWKNRHNFPFWKDLWLEIRYDAELFFYLGLLFLLGVIGTVYCFLEGGWPST